MEDKAFGWPSGTVRGALALMTVGSGLAASLALTVVLALNGQWQAAAALVAGLTSTGGIVTAFYFGSRGTPTPPPSS